MNALCCLRFFNFFPDLSFNFLSEFGVIGQKLPYGIAALSELIGVVAKPATAFLHNAQFNTHVNDLAGFGNSFTEYDIKFRCPERRRNFILNDLYFYPVAYRFVTIFYLRHPPYIQPDRSIKLQ